MWDFFKNLFTYLEGVDSKETWSRCNDLYLKFSIASGIIYRFFRDCPIFFSMEDRRLVFLTYFVYCWVVVGVTVILTVSMKHLIIQRGTRRMTSQRRWLLNSFFYFSCYILCLSSYPASFPFIFLNKEKDRSKNHRHKQHSHKLKEVGGYSYL